MKYQRSEFIELSREALAKGDTIRMRVTGGSMYPFIRGDEVVHVRRAGPSEIRYADIVFTADASGMSVIHRVLKIGVENNKTLFLTKGDALPEADGYFAAEDILGKVAKVEKGNFVMNIDSGVFRSLNICYTVLMPLSRWFYILLLMPFGFTRSLLRRYHGSDGR